MKLTRFSSSALRFLSFRFCFACPSIIRSGGCQSTYTKTLFCDILQNLLNDGVAAFLQFITIQFASITPRRCSGHPKLLHYLNRQHLKPPCPASSVLLRAVMADGVSAHRLLLLQDQVPVRTPPLLPLLRHRIVRRVEVTGGPSQSVDFRLISRSGLALPFDGWRSRGSWTGSPGGGHNGGRNPSKGEFRPDKIYQQISPELVVEPFGRFVAPEQSLTIVQRGLRG